MNILEDMKQYLEQIWAHDSERLSDEQTAQIVIAYTKVLDRMEKDNTHLPVPNVDYNMKKEERNCYTLY